MATVHRTFINRGKNEVTDLKPNFVYAVEYDIDSNTASTLGVRTDQCGIIVVNHYGAITENYNIAKLGEWEKGGVDLKGKHVWRASTMEIAFARMHEQNESLRMRNSNLRENLCQQMRKVHYYESQTLHRYAESFIDIWNEIKRSFRGKDN